MSGAHQHRRTARPQRRAFLAGAVSGLAGVAVASTAEAAAAAEGGPSDWHDVKAYGAVGNGTTDDTAAVQAAITAAATAGGGTVYFPSGKYWVVPTPTKPALTVPGDNVRLVGAGAKTSWLVKGGDGILLRMSGEGPHPAGETHLRYCSVDNLGFNGNSKTGALLELYYADNLYFRDIFMSSNNDLCIDGVEFWDSRFYNLVIESSTGTPDSKTQPNIWLRNTSAASGWGWSPDNVNQIHFTGCRLETFGTGGLWVTQGPNNTNNPNGIYLTDFKFETSRMQGGPHLKIDASCKHVHATNIYCYAGGFASGYSTAQNIITWAAMASSLEDVLIANGPTATVNAGVILYAPTGSIARLRNVVGLYGTKPQGPHIYFEANSPGDVSVEDCYGNIGAQYGGTIPTKYSPNTPLRQVAGTVTDASFARPPADGTMAVDAQNKRLYVRVGGAWMWSPLQR